MFLRLLLIPLMALMATVASSAPVRLLFPDSTFTPGSQFFFSVELPTATNLGSYQIDLLLSGSSGTAGVDYFFDLAGTDAAMTGYVFPSDGQFFDTVNLDSAMSQRLTLSDINFDGMDVNGAGVVSGTNDAIANIVVSTLPTFSGSLMFSVDADALILDTPDLTPTSINEFATIQADTVAVAPQTVTAAAVPEPSGIAMLAVAAVGVLTLRRRRKIAFGESKLR
ncbi:hypothetical protein K227x_09420 [Rubripirellula lacrimiformis]|uniref:PEP-CTERM protein-sorting domain-containing protein n=1 Tax=Rubripirellula lacrimiformis TaxID=1930273 RepID=A0A517N614_9BACT|nr:PEP-CTERM sorting domain-containing protein [Rubripirellula lacrimiformis]QDT02564.1 hypothetical protein K227x_09420 [Rubripirellula lacrimiformis]